MMREIRDAVHAETSELGVNIVDVRIRRTELPRDVLEQTYNRMSAERKAEAEQIRAVGNQQSLTMRAQADRDYTVTLAEAQRDAEITRGQGDAERSRVFERFVRIEGGDRTNGSGLGRAIVRGFAEAMGMTVTIATAPSGGASFILAMPVTMAS